MAAGVIVAPSGLHLAILGDAVALSTLKLCFFVWRLFRLCNWEDGDHLCRVSAVGQILFLLFN